MVKGAAAKAKAQTHEATIVDQFDLQPGEMTKEEVAEELGYASVRSVEQLKKDGKLPAEKLTRRNAAGKIQKMLIFMRDDVDKFKAGRDASETPAGARNALASVDKKTDVLGQAMAFIAQKVGGDTIDPSHTFLTIDEAAERYRLSPIGIHRLLDAGTLTRYPGKNGAAMVSRRQIEAL